MNQKITNEVCPLCAKGQLDPRADSVYMFRYLKKQHQVAGLERSVCSHCKSSFTLPEQSKRNKTKVEEYQNRIIKGISPGDILKLRETYLISQQQAGKIFRCGPTQFSKWERGEVAPTGTAALALREALDNPAFMKKLALRAGVTIAVPAEEHAAVASQASAIIRGRASGVSIYPMGRDELLEAIQNTGDNTFSAGSGRSLWAAARHIHPAPARAQ